MVANAAGKAMQTASLESFSGHPRNKCQSELLFTLAILT